MVLRTQPIADVRRRVHEAMGICEQAVKCEWGLEAGSLGKHTKKQGHGD